jgi:hypothetical protein
MKITLNTTWDDVTREIRSDGTNEQRALCDLASDKVDELEATVDELDEKVSEALSDLEVFTDFMDLQNFTDAEDLFARFNAMKFELDFMRLFFKCQ